MITAIVVVRFLHFLCLMVLFGALAFARILALPPEVTAPEVFKLWQGRFCLACAVGVALTAASWLSLEAAYMSGEWTGALDLATLKAVLLETQFGNVWILRLGLVAALVVATLRDEGPSRPLTLVLAAALLVTLGFVGHAAMRPDISGMVQRANHAVHLLAAGAWVGGLVVVAGVMVAAKPPDAHRALERFSSYGVPVVGAAVLTGLINSVFLLRHWTDLVETDYGVVLSAKIFAVLMAIALAICHRYFFLSRWQPSGNRSTLFAASVIAECFLLIAVLALVAELGTLAPP